MAPAKHLSPPKKADDNDDDWENWGCSSSTRSAATSTYEQKKTNALPASKKFQCVPTPMEQIALGSSNSHNNNNASSTQQQVPKTPSSGRGGFGSNTNANNNKKNFTRLYRTSSPERKAASPTAQVIHSIDEAVDSVLTKSYTGLVGAVSSLASTLDAAVETTALKLDHFASQKMSPPGGRSQKSRTKEEDPMNSPNVVKMRCRESLGSNNSRTSTATSSNSSSSSSSNNNNTDNNSSERLKNMSFDWNGLVRLDILSAPETDDLNTINVSFYGPKKMRVFKSTIEDMQKHADVGNKTCLFDDSASVQEFYQSLPNLRISKEVEISLDDYEGKDLSISGLGGWIRIVRERNHSKYTNPPGLKGSIILRVWSLPGVEVFVRDVMPI